MLYLGTKLVKAEPMTRGDYNKLRGWTVPEDEGYKVTYKDNYLSWSPKTAFEAAYRPTVGLTFGLALDALKSGHRVAREGWNGKNMWLRIVIPGGDNQEYDMAMENLPYIEMKTADDKLVPWLASQTDMMAEDWTIVR